MQDLVQSGPMNVGQHRLEQVAGRAICEACGVSCALHNIQKFAHIVCDSTARRKQAVPVLDPPTDFSDGSLISILAFRMNTWVVLGRIYTAQNVEAQDRLPLRRNGHHPILHPYRQHLMFGICGHQTSGESARGFDVRECLDPDD